MRPDQVHVAITCADGSLVVMTLVTAEYDPRTERPRWKRLATAEYVETEIARASEIWEPEKLPVRSWRFIDVADLPPDRTYRDAWTDASGRVEHDMPKARELHRDMLRRARAPKLSELDVEYVRALESGGPKSAKAADVVERKQRLRDLTADPAIEAARTVEELRAAWPDDLPRD